MVTRTNNETYAYSNQDLQRVIDLLNRSKRLPITSQMHIFNEKMSEIFLKDIEKNAEIQTLTGVNNACHALLDIFLAICAPEYKSNEYNIMKMETVRQLFAIMYNLLHIAANDKSCAQDKNMIAKLVGLLEIRTLKSIDWAEMLPHLEQHGAETILSKVRFKRYEFDPFFQIASSGYFTSPAMMEAYKKGRYEMIAIDGLWKGDTYKSRESFFTKLLVPTMPMNMSLIRKQLVDLSWDGYHKGMSYQDLKDYLQQVKVTANSYKPSSWHARSYDIFPTAETIAILAKAVDDLNPVSKNLLTCINAPVAEKNIADDVQVRFSLNR